MLLEFLPPTIIRTNAMSQVFRLHAAVLGFEHPITGARLRFESDLPADLDALCSALADASVPLKNVVDPSAPAKPNHLKSLPFFRQPLKSRGMA